MDNFSTLLATVSGSSVILSWTLAGDAALATQVQVLREAFGQMEASVVVATLAPSVLTYTDTPPHAGDWTYRLRVTIVRGSVDGAGTPISSNRANVTTEPTTGAVVLTGSVTPPGVSPLSGPAGFNVVLLNWVLDDNDIDDDVVKFVVQRSLNAGVTWRDDVTLTGQLTHREQLPIGMGPIQYRVVAYLPNINTSTSGQLQAPVQSISNVLSFTI